MNPQNIMIRASEILVERGMKPELSPQARAVVEAICEGLNTKAGKMIRPTIEEVKLHGAKIGLPEVECERFFDHFEANGWKVGGVSMKLWTAALANWKRTWLERNPKFSGTVNGSGITFRDIKDECRTKWGEDVRWMNWAASFYNHWAKRGWTRNGIEIDWKIELSSQINRWKAAK